MTVSVRALSVEDESRGDKGSTYGHAVSKYKDLDIEHEIHAACSLITHNVTKCKYDLSLFALLLGDLNQNFSSHRLVKSSQYQYRSQITPSQPGHQHIYSW